MRFLGLGYEYPGVDLTIVLWDFHHGRGGLFPQFSLGLGSLAGARAGSVLFIGLLRQFTYHSLHPFKPLNYFGCIYSCTTISRAWEHFYHPKKIPCVHWKSYPISPFTSNLTGSTFCLRRRVDSVHFILMVGRSFCRKLKFFSASGPSSELIWLIPHSHLTLLPHLPFSQTNFSQWSFSSHALSLSEPSTIDRLLVLGLWQPDDFLYSSLSSSEISSPL